MSVSRATVWPSLPPGAPAHLKCPILWLLRLLKNFRCVSEGGQGGSRTICLTAFVVLLSETGGGGGALNLYLGLFKLQIFPILNGSIDVLQRYVDALVIGAIKRQEPNHAVVVDLKGSTNRFE